MKWPSLGINANQTRRYTYDSIRLLMDIYQSSLFGWPIPQDLLIYGPCKPKSNPSIAESTGREISATFSARSALHKRHLTIVFLTGL